MVFDITSIIKLLCEFSLCSWLNALDFGHDNLKGLSDHVGQ